MSRSTIRCAFLGVALALMIQYGLVGLVGARWSEPWPSILLPGFRTVYATADTIRLEYPQIAVEFEDGRRTSLSTAQLLAPLPRSHHPAFLEAQCRPASLSGTDRTERCQTPNGRRWFIARAEEAFPSESVRAVHVVWSRLYSVPDRRATWSIPVDTLRLAAPFS